MTHQHIRLLVIQPSTGQTQWHELCGSLNIECHIVEDTSQALVLIPEQPVDVIVIEMVAGSLQSMADQILDIGLKQPDIPVIVVTDDDAVLLELQTLQTTVQSYFLNKEINSQQLLQAVRQARSRHDFLIALRQNVSANDLFAEMDSLAGISSTAITAQIMGLADLANNVSLAFDEIVAEYGDILEGAVQRLVFEEKDDTSARLQELATRLGFLKAGPRDVILVHKTALRNKANEGHPARFGAYLEEGRMMVIELMGHLTTYYRKYYLQWIVDDNL